MTRTIHTIAALAVICLSAPAFAHGGGHGGMNMGSNGQNGPSMNSMSWNKVDNKSDHMVDRHHDRKQAQTVRLEAELRRLVMEQQKTTNPLRLAKIAREIRRVILGLKQNGVLID